MAPREERAGLRRAGGGGCAGSSGSRDVKSGGASEAGRHKWLSELMNERG